MKYLIEIQFILVLFMLQGYPLTAQDKSVSRRNYKGEIIVRSYKSVGSLIDTDTLAVAPSAIVGTLSTGFKYYIARNTSSTGKIYIKLVVKAGYNNQDSDQIHVAHLLEHAVFRGTKTFPGDSLVWYLKTKGIERGIDFGASTGFAFTDYDLNIPANDQQLLDACLLAMRERAQDGLLLMDKDIDIERKIVQEEIMVRADPASELRQSLSTSLLKGTCYWDVMHLSSKEQLEGVSKVGGSSVRQFYKDWYRPDLEGIIIVGDIDESDIEKKVIELFSSMATSEIRRNKGICRMGLSEQNTFNIKTLATDEPIEINVYFKQLGTAKRTYGDFKLAMIGQIYNEIVRQRNEHTVLSRNFTAWSSYSERLIPLVLEDIVGVKLHFQSPADSSSSLEYNFKAAFQDIEQIKRYGFNSAEIITAKKKLLNSYTAEFFANPITQVRDFRDHFVRGQASPDAAYSYEMIQRVLKELGAQEVNDVVKEWLSGRHMDVTVLAPEKQKNSLPDKVTFWKWMQETKNSEIREYVVIPKLSVDFNSLYKLPKSKPFKKQYDKSQGITTLSLANGATVVIKTMSSDKIYMQAQSKGGASLYQGRHYYSAVMADEIVEAAGFGEFNEIEFSNYLHENRISAYPYITEREEGITASSGQENLEVLLQIIYRCFTSPRQDIPLVNQWIGRQRKIAEEERIKMSDTISAIKNFGETPWWLPTDNAWDQVDPINGYRIFQEQFSNAGDFVFVVTGVADIDSALPLLVKYIGALPDHGKRDKPQSWNLPNVKGGISEDGKTQKLIESNDQVNMFFSGTYPYAERTMLSFQILSTLLSEVLNARVREKEGGTYTLFTNNVTARTSPSLGLYVQSISFNCTHDNVKQLLQAIDEEITKIKKYGVSKELLDSVLSQIRKANDPSGMNAQAWRIYLAGQVRNHADFKEVFRRQAIIDSFTDKELRDMVARYLSGDNLYKFILTSSNNQIQ